MTLIDQGWRFGAVALGKSRPGTIAHHVILRLACLLSLTVSAWAHDLSSYGGVFRSRDLGGSWLNADVGLFLNAALVVAVDPRDPSHLLVGTDLGLLSSRNGGRSWRAEASDLIFGAVFAVAFSSDGMQLTCAASTGVFRRRRRSMDAGQRARRGPPSQSPHRRRRRNLSARPKQAVRQP